MRETQILRGLHKARATMGHNYANGMVPNDPPPSSFAGIGKSLSRMFASTPKPVTPPPAPAPAPAPWAPPPSNSGAQAIGEAVAPGVVNAIKNRKAMLDSLADGYAPDDLGLRRGAVNLKGPGTTTSDSIPVNLSKGESVLPAKTTAALGADNIAKLIEQTNGKAPARGLRSGGRHAGGAIPDMVEQLRPKAGSPVMSDMTDQLRNNAPKAPTASGMRQTSPLPPSAQAAYNASAEGAATAQTFQKERGFTPRSPSGGAAPTPGATPGATPPPPKPTGLWNQTKYYAGRGADVVGGAAAGAKSTAVGFGKGALGVAGLGLEAAGSVSDMRTPGMTTADRVERGVESASRLGAAAAGASLGATGGTAVGGPVGAVVGGVLGGGLGYFAPDIVSSASEALGGTPREMASARAASLRTGQQATQTPPVEPFNPNQTAATQARLGVAGLDGASAPRATFNTAEQDAAVAAGTGSVGQVWSGRGSVNPRTGTPLPSDPRSRDFSAELNALPAQLPSDLRQGVIHKTVDARGRTTYSGMNVGAGADGQTQMVDGLGKSLKPRGGLHYAAAGAPVAMGAGGFAITPSGGAGQPQPARTGSLSAGQTGALGNSAVSPALAAAAARGDMDAVRAFYQRDGGTFNGRTAQQDAPAPAGVAGFNGRGSQWEREKDAWNNKVDYGSLMKGSPRRVQALLLAQQKMAQDRELGYAGMDVTREGNQLQSNTSLKTAGMQRDASMYGHDISRANNRNTNAVQARGDDLQFQGTQNRIGLDRQRLAHDIGQKAAEGVNEDNMNSPYATVIDENGIPQVNKAKANELGQAKRAAAGRMHGPDGKPISLEQLRASNPAEYNRVNTSVESQIGMGQAINKYAAGNTFGQQTGWAPPNITDVREMGGGDFTKGASLSDALLAPFKPGNRSQGVEIDVGGRKQVIPLSELFAGENGGQYRQLVNEWLIANKRPILGDMNTGE